MVFLLQEFSEVDLRLFQSVLAAAFFSILICGCSNSSDITAGPAESGKGISAIGSGRQLWGYWDVSIHPDTLACTANLRRDVCFHLNARKFLEDTPCHYCLSILGAKPSDHGTLLVDVQLRHPFLGLPQFTGFDVRGTVIFPGSMEWPGNGLVTSESDFGEGELINADGYTRLFNPLEYPSGTGPLPILEYSHGTRATADPDTTLNGYKNFYTFEDRRYFLAGEAIIRTYDISFPPGPMLFGYAVDACWQAPAGGPPIQVPDSFPISANCLEAYQVSATQLGKLEQGSSCLIWIDVYDWQGTDTIGGVLLEAPDVFDGVGSAAMVQDNGSWARFQATVLEEKSADVGEYDCLVRVDDNHNDPNLGYVPAYSMFELSVVEGTAHDPECDGNLFLIADGNTFCDPQGEDNAKLMENMVLFDTDPGEFHDADVVKFYNGHHGKFNSYLTHMETLVNSLGFTFMMTNETPIDITACRMIVIYEPGFFDVDLFTPAEVADLLYFLHNGGRVLMVSDYTEWYYQDKTTFNDLLAKLGCTVYDDAYTHIGGIYVTDLADCPVMEGVAGFSMAANTRFILGPDDTCLGYSGIGGGVMLCSTLHYN
jgi:hypothetical protein